MNRFSKVISITRKRGIIWGLATVLLGIALLLGITRATFATYTLSDTTADRVYGQDGSFTTSTPGVGTTKQDYTSGIAVAPDGGVYVVDTNNHRVLYYPGGSTTATRVYGQGESGDQFTSLDYNKGGADDGNGGRYPTASSLNNPIGVAVAADGSLYVADVSNNRVLFFQATNGVPAFKATRVYGQGGSFTSKTDNIGGTPGNYTNNWRYPTDSSLWEPTGLAISPLDGSLYVLEQTNSRVLHFSGTSTTADRVYGQGSTGTGSEFNTKDCETKATKFCYPYAVAVAADGSLYVGEDDNKRVVYFPATNGVPAFTATRVYGQGALGTNLTDSNYGTSDTEVGTITGVAVAPDGSIFVADRSNNRVLHFPAYTTGGTSDFTADQVYGQGGSFTTHDCNEGGDTTSGSCLRLPTADNMFDVRGIALDANGGLYVGDAGNYRALYFAGASAPPPPVEKEVVVVYASDLVPQLRVSPDRVVATNFENLVSFSFKVKNIGAGGASNLVISMPVPQGLGVGYLDGASVGVWVTQLSVTSVTIALPNLEPGKEASGTLIFRPNSSAVVGAAVDVRYNLVYDDATKGGKSLFSNHEQYVYGSAENNHDETKGAVQPGAAVSAKAGEKVSIVQTGYLADELVAQWYTAPNGTTVSLGTHRATADGVVTIMLDTVGVVAGDYAVVGYGNRSEFTQVNILTVVAG
ncbi:MAG: NHL repeat-containing protein [Chloroflexota bacterium]